MSVSDDDGGITTQTHDITVNNVAPSVAADNDPVTVNEGDTATNTGTANLTDVTASDDLLGAITLGDVAGDGVGFEDVEAQTQSEVRVISLASHHAVAR